MFRECDNGRRQVDSYMAERHGALTPFHIVDSTSSMDMIRVPSLPRTALAENEAGLADKGRDAPVMEYVGECIVDAIARRREQRYSQIVKAWLRRENW